MSLFCFFVDVDVVVVVAAVVGLSAEGSVSGDGAVPAFSSFIEGGSGSGGGSKTPKSMGELCKSVA